MMKHLKVVIFFIGLVLAGDIYAKNSVDATKSNESEEDSINKGAPALHELDSKLNEKKGGSNAPPAASEEFKGEISDEVNKQIKECKKMIKSSRQDQADFKQCMKNAKTSHAENIKKIEEEAKAKDEMRKMTEKENSEIEEAQ